jgi:hypothetical protein
MFNAPSWWVVQEWQIRIANNYYFSIIVVIMTLEKLTKQNGYKYGIK